MTVYHEAARDGYLDILREATRRDCDKADEDGMTPVLWAAYHGNLDALRTLAVRGGNPDKSDYLGNSALHLAAANGHMNCVSYLVSYGCNLWALDNDFHTPLDVAALNERDEVVKYLDMMSATQSLRNKKLVKKFKEKAVLDAQKRVKRYSKLQAKAQKKAEREDKRLAEEREKMLVEADPTATTPHSAPASVYSTLRSDRLSKMSISSHKTTLSEPKPYSAHFTLNSTGGRRILGGTVARKVKDRKENGTGGETNPHEFKIRELEGDGTRTIKPLTGLRRDPQVMYTTKPGQNGHTIKSSDHVARQNANNKDADAISRAISEPDFTNLANEDSGIESADSNPAGGSQESGLFERPGFGTVSFMNKRTTGALMSLPWNNGNEGEDDDGEDKFNSAEEGNNKQTVKSRGKASRVHRKGSCSDSIGTLGSLAVRISDVPWDESDVDCLDDDDVMEPSTLELFLTACGLTEFFSLLTKEKIDLEALMLLTDSDFKELGLPLGPRKKLADAISRRKVAMSKPGAILDTRL